MQQRHGPGIDGVKVLRPTRRKIGHFWDVLPSQSLGLVLKKLNLLHNKSKQHKMAKTQKAHLSLKET